ncbi:MAG: chromosome segregation protein SMC [Deinococcota bacterium]|nr:chromosome segregation protein SMC [Deinococcota bacterium]
MRLTSISLLGFKSFGDRVLLEFGPGINAIVGPNGSGKSNVIDGLRWVTGGGRAGAYRAEERTDLIFHGAEGKRGLNFAEVALRLDMPGKTLNLSRGLFRDGQGKLLLGGKAARLLDVEEALAGSGLGRGGLSVIGQGEVGGVLVADPGKLLSYVEEATGVARLSGRREATLARLEAAREQLERLDDLLVELRSGLDKLGAEAERAARAVALGARVLQLRYTLATRRCQGLSAEVAVLRTEGERLKAALEAGKEETLAAQSAWQTSRQAVALQEAGYRERLTQAEARKGDLRVAEARAQNLLERRAAQEREERRLGEESARLKARLEPVAPKARLDTLEARFAEESGQHDKAHREVQRLKAALEEGRLAFTELQSQAATDAQAVTAYETRHGQLAQEREVTVARLGELRAARVKAELGALEAERAALSAGVSRLQGALEAAREETAALQNDHARLHAQAQVLARGATRARAAHGARQGYAEGPRHALKSNIPGVIGSIADLIAVPPEYASALGSALGRRAEQVVVDTAETAQEVLNQLKRSGGRVTLLPLDLIQDRTEGRYGELEGQPGYLGLVTGLIRFEGRYRAVVRQLLGGTAFVETLEHGVALARRFNRRPRLVTLGGDLIEAYGALTGGRAQTAGAQLVGALAELEATELEAAQAEAASAELSSRVKAAQAALRERTAALAGAREALEVLDGRLTQGRLRQAGQASLQTDLERRLQGLDADLNALKPPQTSVRGGDLEARGKALDRLKLVTAAAEAEFTERLAARTQAQQALAVYSERWRRFEEEAARFAAAQSRLITVQGQLEGLGGERARLEHNLLNARRALEAAQAALPRDLDRQAQAFETVKRESQAAEARLTSLSAVQAKLGAELEAGSLSLARRETSLEAAQEDLDGFPSGLQAVAGSLKGLRDELAEAQEVLEGIGPVNHRAALEGAEQQARLTALEAQAEEARAAVNELGGLLTSIDREVSSRLGNAIGEVRQLFIRYSKALFGGGEADILVEREEGRPSGLRISLQPPGKTTRSLNLLSVGERTMGAMAFLFALMAGAATAEPSADAAIVGIPQAGAPQAGIPGLSIAILDEVDAPLDEANIRRFCDFLTQLARGGTQFILVTHQKATMEVADTLWGVTSERGVSRVFSISKGQTLAASAS